MARRERSDGKILDFKEIMFTLTLNGNIFVGNLVLLIACLMFGYQGAQIGTIIYAQNTLLRQICDLNIYLVEGLGFATETLVGNFKGQETNFLGHKHKELLLIIITLIPTHKQYFFVLLYE